MHALESARAREQEIQIDRLIAKMWFNQKKVNFSYHKLEDHVEHPLRAVGLQELDNVWVLQHVADGGLALEVVQAQAGAGGKLGNVDDFHSKLLACLPMDASSD